jgi:hypothetical protein
VRSLYPVGVFGLLILIRGYCSGQTGTFQSFDFEGFRFPDSTVLTDQIPGVTFTNSIILTSGITLNEREFPPRSGINVVSDNGGPINIAFSPPIERFTGYFTYRVQLTVRAFDNSHKQIGIATSKFSGNEVHTFFLFPNEAMQVGSATNNISSVSISGDSAGSSFVLDDVFIERMDISPTPVPPTLLLTLLGLALSGFAAFVMRRKAGTGMGRMTTMATAIAVLLPCGLWLSGAPREPQPRPRPSLDAPRIERFSANRTALFPKTPTPVTLSARINHPAHIASAVNLIRVDASGRPTIVGRMHDDGKDGDAVAGDHIYTIRATLNEPSTGQVRFQVSTAFQGLERRVLSDSLTLTIKAPR